MDTIFYKPITYQTILRKENWKQGGNAITSMSDAKEGELWIEVNMYGKTKEEATDKLLKFLSSNGQTKIECVGAK